MNIKGLFILTALFAVQLVSAQQFHRCATDHVINYWENQSPGYKASVDAAFDEARAHYFNTQAGSRQSGPDTIFRIPVVVHIVYNTPAENISDSLVYSQIEVLNEDYNRRNPDTLLTRPVFQPIAGNAGIEFYLATEDPQGNPTTGITRTQTSVQSWSSGFLPDPAAMDSIKLSSGGGADAWDTDNYLNIWVGDLSSNGQPSVLGYAYPPAGTPNWPAGQDAPSPNLDGVVIHYQVFGRNNPATQGSALQISKRGRTTTHEVGHYLGLRHIWGDGIPFFPDCNADDGISDTPFMGAGSQQTCDTTVNSCTDSPIDYPDMIENYMDYSADSCQNMFSKEQVGIMRSSLFVRRTDLAEVVVDSGSTITSIDDIVIEDAFEVYPNPNKGEFTLQYQVPQDKIDQMTIFNSMGQQVKDFDIRSVGQSSLTVALQDAPDGMYFIRLLVAGQSVTRKVMIAR